jgi:hypothetical protein
MRFVLSLAAVLPLALPAQQLTFVSGPANACSVVTVPESQPTAPGTVVLANAELLPIEITGRTLGQGNDPTQPRVLVRHGVPRLELPDGGRVCRYRRAGGAFWGFLWLAADGTPRIVLERPGTGALLEDPFADRVAVAVDGRHLAVPELAGGLWLCRLDGGVFASTGRADRRAIAANREVIASSVLLGTTHLFCITDRDELLRCAFADGSTAADISPPAVSRGFFRDELVLSRDGQRCVCLYGARDQQQFWLLTTAGGPQLLPPPPGRYEGPGYLPEGAGEPAMLLDAVGTRLFYIDSAVRDELHLLDLNGVLGDLQITESQLFQPYIGAHILPRFTGPKLLVAIGDPGQMDWFRVDLAPGGGTVDNLTQTGTPLPPFGAGQLAPSAAVDAGAALLALEQTGPVVVARRIDLATGAQTLVQGEVAGAPLVGSGFGGAVDVVLPSNSGDRLYRGALAQPFVAAPPGVLLDAPVHGPWGSAVWVHLANGLGVVAYYLVDGTLVTGAIETGVSQVVLTAAGGAAVLGTTPRLLSVAGQVALPWPAGAVLLSGAGG